MLLDMITLSPVWGSARIYAACRVTRVRAAPQRGRNCAKFRTIWPGDRAFVVGGGAPSSPDQRVAHRGR